MNKDTVEDASYEAISIMSDKLQIKKEQYVRRLLIHEISHVLIYSIHPEWNSEQHHTLMQEWGI